MLSRNSEFRDENDARVESDIGPEFRVSKAGGWSCPVDDGGADVAISDVEGAAPGN
jgi:hypothetical protein